MLGALAWVQGDLNAAKASAEVGAAIAQSLKDEYGFMRCIETLALCEMDEEEFDKARMHLEDNLVRSNALGDHRGISVTTGNLGRLSMLEGQYDSVSTHEGEPEARPPVTRQGWNRNVFDESRTQRCLDG